jgi:hypothetical protein
MLRADLTARAFFGVDSGLYILSRHPILAQDQMTFGSSNCDRWDCLASKGAQFVRISSLSFRFRSKCSTRTCRRVATILRLAARQVKLLWSFYKKNHYRRQPVIFGGDFNIRPRIDREAYDEFVLGDGLGNSAKYCVDRGCAHSADAGCRQSGRIRSITSSIRSTAG